MAAESIAKFEQRACADSVPAGVRCGVVQVPEDYSRQEGRQIELNVLVLPAPGKTSREVAQYDLEGGPGYGATRFLSFYAGEGAAYRKDRDIVLADMRGTGESHALRCPQIESYERAQPTAPMYPPELVEECARDLASRADVTKYSTLSAAHDIERVRIALGYQQLDLNAVSYGTTLALRYLAEYPERVRAAALVGTAPPQSTPPRHHASAADRALSLVIEDCKADAECAKAFPHVEANLERARSLAARTGSALSPDVFMEKLRALMYTPLGQRRVPLVLQQAAQGNLATFTGASPAASEVFADGLYLAITCAESFERMDVPAAIAAADRTRFGSYRLRRQSAACAKWPRAPTEQASKQLVSPTPVLMIAGDIDPATPPGWAADTLKQFSNGRLEVIRYGGHVFDGLSDLDTCFDRVVIDFFASADASRVDASCLVRMRPPPYALK